MCILWIYEKWKSKKKREGESQTMNGSKWKKLSYARRWKTIDLSLTTATMLAGEMRRRTGKLGGEQKRHDGQ